MSFVSPGSFLNRVPSADIYVMRMILHDWPGTMMCNYVY
jgi:hypothetical protein